MTTIFNLIEIILKDKILPFELLKKEIQNKLDEDGTHISLEKIEKKLYKLNGNKFYVWNNKICSLNKYFSKKENHFYKISFDKQIKEFCKLNYEDLKYVIETHTADVSDISLRRTSTIIRRLIIDGDLQKTWSFFGYPGEIKIKINDFDKELNQTNKENIILATAGGGKYQGTQVKSLIIMNKALTSKEVKEDYNRLSHQEQVYKKISDYRKMTFIFYKNIMITVDDIIKYIANKKGGVHFDSKREKSSELTQKFQIMDNIQTIQIIDKNTIYYQYLSLVEFLIESPDIKRLFDLLRVVNEL